MYKKTIFLYGGKGLQKRGSTLYNRKAVSRPALKGLDNYLLSMIKGVSLQSRKKGSGIKLQVMPRRKTFGGSSQHKNWEGGGLKFVR